MTGLTGPAVNAGVIVICALAGRFLIRHFPERFERIIRQGIALVLLYIGISGAMESRRVLVLVLSILCGALIGEALDIDRAMNRLGLWAERRAGLSGGNFSKGFVSASVLFCTGSMAIVGALNSGLAGDHEMLFVKSVLDGVITVVLAAQLGLGVLFSAAPVLLYEGSIALGASFLKDWLTPEMTAEMSAAGSLLIAAIGINFLGACPHEIKVTNLIPAIFMPCLFLAAGIG